MYEWVYIIVGIIVFFVFLAILAAVSTHIGNAENMFVSVDGQQVLFIEPEKEQWMNVLSTGLERLKEGENMLHYGMGRYSRLRYDRSLQSHVTQSVYGVLVLTNFRLIFLQRKRKAAFSQEHEYHQAITLPISLVRYTDRDEDKLRIGTLRTSHGRKVENIDFEVEPQFASILQTQINELVAQYNSVKKVAETKKKQDAVVMVPLRCPKCNGQLQPTTTKNIYECKYCGTTVVVKS